MPDSSTTCGRVARKRIPISVPRRVEATPVPHVEDAVGILNDFLLQDMGSLFDRVTAAVIAAHASNIRRKAQVMAFKGPFMTVSFIHLRAETTRFPAKMIIPSIVFQDDSEGAWPGMFPIKGDGRAPSSKDHAFFRI